MSCFKFKLQTVKTLISCLNLRQSTIQPSIMQNIKPVKQRRTLRKSWPGDIINSRLRFSSSTPGSTSTPGWEVSPRRETGTRFSSRSLSVTPLWAPGSRVELSGTSWSTTEPCWTCLGSLSVLRSVGRTQDSERAGRSPMCCQNIHLF